MPINSPGAPSEGSEAGDAGDGGHRHMVENVKRHRASAVRHFRAAQRLADQDRAAAEQEARTAIVEIVHAFWWAEDSELQEDQHTLAEADCKHRPDRLYRVMLTKIITKMDVREVSLVSRPAGVTTRLLAISVDNTDLIEALGPDFEVGMPVSCDKCLNGC